MRTDPRPSSVVSEERYRQLFENAPIGIVNVDLTGRPLVVNQRACTTFGYDSPDDFLANVPSMLDLWVIPRQREEAAEIMLETGVLRDFEVLMKRRDGARITLSVSANPWHDRDGNVVGMQVSGIEVTERVEAERRLEEAQSHASIGFWSWRFENNEIDFTKGVTMVVDDQLTERSFFELIHPEDQDMVSMKLATLKRVPGESFENEFRIVTPAGETKWVMARGRVDDDGGRVSGSLQDITAQKQVEVKLTELNDMKTEFVSVVAHDLRLPLTVAAGYAEFLDEQWSAIEDEDRRELVGRIQRSLDRLGVLVADVLEVTRLDSGAVQFDMKPFDLAQLVRSTVEDVASIEPFPVCDLTIPEHLPHAMGDRESMWRVVTNLLSNAAKYSPDGAHVGVEIKRRNGSLEVSVSDKGPGISVADQSKLFQKFSRISPNGSGPRPSGTGLGLFICRSLVEGSGGSIWVDSTPGEGATFRFTVPVASEPF